MKNTLKQVFKSGKFLTGFFIMAALLLTMIIYPLINPGDPLLIIGLGSFQKPGTYVSVYDSLNTEQTTFKLPNANENRIKVAEADAIAMQQYLIAVGVPESRIDISDTPDLLQLWKENFKEGVKVEGFTLAQRRYYTRLNESFKSNDISDSVTIMDTDAETGELVEIDTVGINDYVNVKDVANTITLPLGTDTFGRDVLKELVAALGVSLMIGLIAGAIATFIGLSLGLLSGYVGGIVDDIIMFITNVFTVIPSFVLLLLISYGIGQDNRGAAVVAIVIGATSWVWTTRAVRAQVISLRNRDHVNLSKLSGHSLLRIILTDILPYIASYVVMAFILQVSSAILAEAQLSMLGLGPSTTKTPTLGLMMNWSMLYAAHLQGYWWAYFPVLLTIALISFSLNLMNTGLDQVFNPTLRD